MTNTIHTSSLSDFAEHHRAAHTSEDRIVDGWEGREGLVYVNGERVLSGSGSTDVRVQRSFPVACLKCKHHNVHVPLVLHVRFEHALDRLMFWFGPAGMTRPAWCEECEDKAPPMRGLAMKLGVLT
jgi:hypothetical protein